MIKATGRDSDMSRGGYGRVRDGMAVPSVTVCIHCITSYLPQALSFLVLLLLWFSHRTETHPTNNLAQQDIVQLAEDEQDGEDNVGN